jgi:hypothetical protein
VGQKAGQAQQQVAIGAPGGAQGSVAPVRAQVPHRKRRDIFISYRRADALNATGRIYDVLVARYGKARVFKDVDSLRGGDDFARTIAEIISHGAVVLVVIGRRWLDTRDKAGQRRLDNQEDLVRREVEAALGATGVTVVPVLVEGAHMPAAGELPEGMRRLPELNGVVVNDDPDFGAGMHRLIRHIDLLLPAGMRPPVRRRRLALGASSGVALVGVLAALLRSLVFSAPSPPPPYQGSSTFTDRLTNVMVSSSGDAWVVGTHNNVNGILTGSFILHLSHGTWVTAYTLTQPVALNSIAMISSTEGWAVGERGIILHDSNGQWTTVAPVTDKTLFDVAASPATGEAWAVGADGTILQEVGATWRVVFSPTPVDLFGVAVSPTGEAWAVGAGGTILHAAAGGVWTTVASPITSLLHDVVVGPSGEAWAVGTGGTLLHEVAGTWTKVASPTSMDLLAIAVGPSTGEAWAVGRGTILHEAGGVWTTAKSPTPEDLLKVAVSPSGEAWAVAADGTILHAAGGSVWTIVLSPAISPFVGSPLFGMAVGRTGEVWAVGAGGTILYEAGDVWTTVASPTSVDLFGVAVSPATGEAWAVGAEGTILHKAGGSVWTKVASPTSVDLLGVAVSPSGEAWAVGSGGQLLHYAGPESWSLINGPQTKA